MFEPLLGVNVLYWRKNVGHCWDFSAFPVIRHLRHRPPCPRCYASGVTLRDKERSCEIPRALNVAPLLRIDRSQLRWFGHMSRMSHKRLARQVLLAKHTGKWPRDRPRPSWMTASATLLGPVLLWSQQNYLKLMLTVRYSKISSGFCPTTSLEEKRAWKWMKWKTFALFSLFNGVQKCPASVSKLLRRLELINANVETARNYLTIIHVHDTFHRK